MNYINWGYKYLPDKIFGKEASHFCVENSKLSTLSKKQYKCKFLVGKNAETLLMLSFLAKIGVTRNCWDFWSNPL